MLSNVIGPLSGDSVITGCYGAPAPLFTYIFHLDRSYNFVGLSFDILFMGDQISVMSCTHAILDRWLCLLFFVSVCVDLA